MRVMTYNIRGWRGLDDDLNLEKVARVIQESGADIVGLNEVYHPHPSPRLAGQADGGRGSSSGSVLSELAEACGMHYLFGPCLGWPATQELPANSFGNGLLSRWPILAGAAHHLTPIPDHEQRGLLEARVLLPGARPFTVYVTHLDHKSEENRLIQLRAIRSWTVRDRRRPHLVMGDFNAVSPWDFRDQPQALAALDADGPQPHAAADLTARDGRPQVVAQMERAGYTDLYGLCGEPGQRTFLDSPRAIRIDYIFGNRAIVPWVKGCGIWAEASALGASDHLPVWADLDEPPPDGAPAEGLPEGGMTP